MGQQAGDNDVSSSILVVAAATSSDYQPDQSSSTNCSSYSYSMNPGTMPTSSNVSVGGPGLGGGLNPASINGGGGSMSGVTSASSAATSRSSSGYHQKAMEEIHNSLLPFAKTVGSGGGNGCNGGEASSAASTISNLSATSGVSSMGSSSGSNGLQPGMAFLDESSLRLSSSSGCRPVDGSALDYLLKQQQPPPPPPPNVIGGGDSGGNTPLNKNYPKLIRKPSIERELSLYQQTQSPYVHYQHHGPPPPPPPHLHYHHHPRVSPAMDSGAGSSRSDSPRTMSDNSQSQAPHIPVTRQYSPNNVGLVVVGGVIQQNNNQQSSGGQVGVGEPPPPPPPRNTPPPPPPSGGQGQYGGQGGQSGVQHMFKRMPPAPVVPTRSSPALQTNYSSPSSSQRGTSPILNPSSNTTAAQQRQQPMIVQNGPHAQQQLSQQMQALSIYQSNSNNTTSNNSNSSNGQVNGNGGPVVNGGEPPPPYPLMSSAPSPSSGVGSSIGTQPPPSYSASIQNRQSPTQDFRKSPSSGIYSGSASAGSPSPVPPSNTAIAAATAAAAANSTQLTSTTSATSASSSSSSTVQQPMARPTPLQAWGARQAKTQPPIMQSVKSIQVQKPILQTATAPAVPPTAPSIPSSGNSGAGSPAPPPSYNASIQQKHGHHGHGKPAAPLPNTASNNHHTTNSPTSIISSNSTQASSNSPVQLGSGSSNTVSNGSTNGSTGTPSPLTVAPSTSPTSQQQQQGGVPTSEPPSYASTMQAKAKAVHRGSPLPPPPPYTSADNDTSANNNGNSTASPISHASQLSPSNQQHAQAQRKYSSPGAQHRSNSPQQPPAYPENAPPLPPTASSSVKNNTHQQHTYHHNQHQYHQQSSQQQYHQHPPPPHPTSSQQQLHQSTNHQLPHRTSAGSAHVNGDGGNVSSTPPPQLPPHNKIRHQSPIPERKKISKEKEDERRDVKVKNYSPQAFKFFMEQHIENVIKSYKQRMYRRMQLENEMNKIGLSTEAQCQMRKMLSQKESNYIRLKRAKMDKSMFVKIKPIGLGAFGEVSLVRKIDTKHLYAMKTLRKSDVLKRNQVAHVKAERDILAEADNEWVVKLYYSFQDSDNLYFVMDYIPGGDLMSLLIKLGIFQENLARFYIAELTCAVESVHKMGFIHRDIKPDNILIDRDGHIKLTDFGLCTGFRWTHNSKYYQPNDHARQDSMEPMEDWADENKCKLLERRRRIEHQRCLAHSLVGTPNYIAPEVLLRTGYTQLCDWWSVGVILYEMLVGSPPFLANTPAETQHKVINWQTTLHIPKEAKLSNEGTDLILKLCCSCEKRLGKNATEVKSHPFFKEIDYDKGLRRQRAPHIPIIEYPTDTSNFDPIDPDKLRNSGSLDSINSDDILDNSTTFHGFFEFTFRRFFDDGGGPAFNKINLDDNDQGPVYV